MKRLLIVRDIVDAYIDKIEVPQGKDKISIKRNEYTHSYGVASLAQILAMKRGLNAEVAGIIGHLHDVGRIIYNILDSRHSQIGAVETEKILKDINLFKQDEINLICSAVKNHMDKGNIGDPYDELIKDADVLERFLWKHEYICGTIKEERLKNVCRELELKLN